MTTPLQRANEEYSFYSRMSKYIFGRKAAIFTAEELESRIRDNYSQIKGLTERVERNNAEIDDISVQLDHDCSFHNSRIMSESRIYGTKPEATDLPEAETNKKRLHELQECNAKLAHTIKTLTARTHQLNSNRSVNYTEVHAELDDILRECNRSMKIAGEIAIYEAWRDKYMAYEREHGLDAPVEKSIHVAPLAKLKAVIAACNEFHQAKLLAEKNINPVDSFDPLNLEKFNIEHTEPFTGPV